MIEAYKKMMTNYAKFDGRTSRRDFWLAFGAYLIMSLLLSTILGGIAGVLDGGVAIATDGEVRLGVFSIIVSIITSIFSLVHLVPVLAIEIRRLHDINKSGWFILLGLLTVCCGIGSIILIIFYCLPSVDEGNQYGEKV
jgi:uncharacterized membrane protein YhaH (DUF805 family)